MYLDVCTITDTKVLDNSTLAENCILNPFYIVTILLADALPRRATSNNSTTLGGKS